MAAATPTSRPSPPASIADDLDPKPFGANVPTPTQTGGLPATAASTSSNSTGLDYPGHASASGRGPKVCTMGLWDGLTTNPFAHLLTGEWDRHGLLENGKPQFTRRVAGELVRVNYTGEKWRIVAEGRGLVLAEARGDAEHPLTVTPRDKWSVLVNEKHQAPDLIPYAHMHSNI